MPKDQILELAKRQHGLVTRAQILVLDGTPSSIQHALRKGLWQRVLPGVYATFSGEITNEHQWYAAVLYGGPSATLTGAVACQLAELRYVPDDDLVRLLVPTTVTRSSTAFVRVTTTTRPPTPEQWFPANPPGRSILRQPLPVAPIARAVVDAARVVGMATAQAVPRLDNGRPLLLAPAVARYYDRSLRDVRALLCEAVQRQLVEQEELVGELEAGPRQGSALARRAVADLAAGCLSAPECELRDLIVLSDVLPPARFNEPLPGYPRLKPDACWPERRLIVEIDSVEWHRSPEAYERTEQRRALLAAMGWTVIPVSPRRLRACPGEVLAEIEAAYAAAYPA